MSSARLTNSTARDRFRALRFNSRRSGGANTILPKSMPASEILRSSLGVDAEELTNGCYQCDRGTIVGMGFHGLEEVSPSVRPTTGMDQFRTAHSIIAAVTVGL